VNMIRKLGNPILENSCEPLTAGNYTLYLSRFLMRTIPLKKKGLGFAGNQVGVPYRIFSMRRNGNMFVVINPRIKKLYGEKMVHMEGCLSIPKKEFEVERHLKIDLEYRDKNFEKKTITLENMEAVIAQHEIDHLDGVLISMNEVIVRRNIKHGKIL